MQRPVHLPTGLARRQGDPWVALDLFRHDMVELTSVVNTATQGVGAVLASASTLKPTNAIHHVSGTATIQTINAPPGFTGPLFLIADNGFSFTTGGNIASAGVVSANTEAMLIFDGRNWYPVVGAGSSPPTNVITVVSVSTTTSLTTTTAETVVLADPTAGAFTVTLPAAATSGNMLVYVKNVTTGGNQVTVKGNGAETIDGQNTQAVNPGSDIDMACNGSAWFII